MDTENRARKYDCLNKWANVILLVVSALVILLFGYLLFHWQDSSQPELTRTIQLLLWSGICTLAAVMVSAVDKLSPAPLVTTTLVATAALIGTVWLFTISLSDLNGVWATQRNAEVVADFQTTCEANVGAIRQSGPNDAAYEFGQACIRGISGFASKLAQ